MNRAAIKKIFRCVAIGFVFSVSFAGPCAEDALPAGATLEHPKWISSRPHCEGVNIFTSPGSSASDYHGWAFGPDSRPASSLDLFNLLNPSESDHLVKYEVTPFVSPDGERMVYSNDCVKSGIPPFGKRNYEIFSSRIDGTDRVRQTNTKSDELYPVWSRSGKRIAFISQNHTTEPYHTLFTMAMDGSDARSIQFDDGEVSLAPAAWSPKDELVAFRINSEPWLNLNRFVVADVEKNVIIVSIESSELIDQNSSLHSLFLNPVWLPDGERVAFGVIEYGQKVDDVLYEYAQHLYIIDMHGSITRIYTDIFQPANKYNIDLISYYTGRWDLKWDVIRGCVLWTDGQCIEVD